MDKTFFVEVNITKFVVSRCGFCKLRRNFGSFCSVNHLSGPLRKLMLTCDWCISIHFVCFYVFAACDRPVSDCFRQWSTSFFRSFLWSFLFLSLARITHQSIPPAPTPPPSRATAGHLPALLVPGVGHLQILHCPGAGHLPTQGPFPSFWHARGFPSEYNYTEGFTGKKCRLAHLSNTGINWRGL